MSDMPESERRFLPHLTTRQVADLDRERAVVVLPLASIEQHGPHLPLFTDSLIVREVLERALALLPGDVPVWVLPLLPYGKSNEHARYPGTITLTSETLIQVLKDIGRSVARGGFQRLVVLNGHGGNAEVVDLVIRDIREETGLLVFALHVYLRVAVPTEGLTEAEQTYGIHAGDVETSILLRCCPELVQRDLAPASLPAHLQTLKYPPFMGPLTFAWLTEDITDTGVLGDATVADPAKGERFLADAAAQTADLLREIAGFRFAP
ncbi:MAG: creatininase family protein [Chloroflexi bacterium]|nr:creatininase family protein [Chloroflexota bacterium]MBU1746512.1 creatininase family protein [Chloroflexota bacterium]MBU1877610.1 creatininase family protein [Chloroflexota bacterium]